LVSAALVHVDATHLITNLTAALPECVALEEQQGSAGLAADLVLLTLTSHALYGEQQWQQQQWQQQQQQQWGCSTRQLIAVALIRGCPWQAAVGFLFLVC
jgi:hypothetical protein